MIATAEKEIDLAAESLVAFVVEEREPIGIVAVVELVVAAVGIGRRIQRDQVAAAGSMARQLTL